MNTTNTSEVYRGIEWYSDKGGYHFRFYGHTYTEHSVKAVRAEIAFCIMVADGHTELERKDRPKIKTDKRPKARSRKGAK
jgi:hypothetical protein